jgi:hypothetical protein
VFRILGYVESTQAPAGTWATSPSKVQLFGPGVKRPGDVVQTQTASMTNGNNTSSTTFAVISGDTVSITPSSAPNLIRAEAFGSMLFITGNTASLQLSRGTTNNTNLIGSVLSGTTVNGTGNPTYPASLLAFDLPNTVSAQAYAVQGKATASGVTYPSAGNGIMAATEIQI